MDPQANLKEQRQIANFILKRSDTDGDDFDMEELTRLQEDATRLAELVLALDEWRKKGGFDPYTA